MRVRNAHERACTSVSKDLLDLIARGLGEAKDVQLVPVRISEIRGEEPR